MRGVTLCLFLLLFSFAGAQAQPVHGRLQLQMVHGQEGSHSVSAFVHARDRNDLLGDARLEWTPREGDWSFDFAYVLSLDNGDSPRFAAIMDKITQYIPFFPSAPPATWWNLTNTFIKQPHFTATQTIDRLSVRYTNGPIVIRAGRQALTWGAGLVFKPMDLFDPFAPDATDIEYKPGTDMLYGQYLFDDGSDLQAVIVPRPAHKHGGLTANASSFALRYHMQIGDFQTTWMVARDHGDMVAGLGINGSLGDATWNAEAIPTFVNGGDTYVSAILNISNAGNLFDRDITYFAVYYRNGFGMDAKHYSLIKLPVPLIDRVLRGQVFDTGRDYFAMGAKYQWTALLEVDPTVIVNLNDRSFYAVGEATYSLNDNLNLIVGARLPVGPNGSEFGGIPLISHLPVYLEQPERFYMQLRRYF